jgi:DNA-binding NarL/FixJ family response regulator
MICPLIIHASPISIFHLGLRALLGQTSDIQIIGEATEREQMVTLIREHNPDSVLFDASICHPASTAVELISHLCKAGARGIIVFAPDSGPLDEELFFQFLKSGAAAYERPNLSGGDLIEKLRRVASGEYLITNDALQQPAVVLAGLQALRQISEAATSPQAQNKSDPPLISERELEVLRNIMKGLSNKQIAQAMKISDQTVKNHITSILKKAHRSDRTSAVVWALRQKLLFLEEAEPVLGEQVVEQRLHNGDSPKETSSQPEMQLASHS